MDINNYKIEVIANVHQDSEVHDIEITRMKSKHPINKQDFDKMLVSVQTYCAVLEVKKGWHRFLLSDAENEVNDDFKNYVCLQHAYESV